MRPTIIAGNWKMNLDLKTAKELALGLKENLKLTNSTQAWVFPSHLHIPAVAEILNENPIRVGIQNIFPSHLTAMTGETSPIQAEEMGIRLGLVGHSERRQFHGETNFSCQNKIQFLLDLGWTVCYCIGERLEEREAGLTFSVLTSQVREGLSSIPMELFSNLTIAYEPVWAIGTGKTATPEMAEEAHSFIRMEISKITKDSIANSIPILYGGSVKPDNVKSLLSQPNIDGGLVGGASQSLESYLALF